MKRIALMKRHEPYKPMLPSHVVLGADKTTLCGYDKTELEMDEYLQIYITEGYATRVESDGKVVYRPICKNCLKRIDEDA